MKDKVSGLTPYQEEKARLTEEEKQRQRSIGLKPLKLKTNPVRKRKRLRTGEKQVQRVLIHLNRGKDEDIFNYAVRIGERHKIAGGPESGTWWKAVLRLMIGMDDYIIRRRTELAAQRQRLDEEWEAWKFKE